MRNSCNLVKGKVVLTTQIIGPRHDPYGRTVIKMIGHDGREKWQLILCSLAGVSFRQFEGFEAQATEHDIGIKAMYKLVYDTTGMSINFWEHDLWEYQDRAMFARLGREKYEQVQMCIEADERLLRYAM